ncbi:MAG: type I pullulanase [Prevotella sp.]|nr:type I pullulanase [Prevotella sp.]
MKQRRSIKRVTLILFCILHYSLCMAQDFDFNEMEYTPYQTTFQLFAPATGKAPKVRIYKQGMGGKAVKTATMKRTGDIWTATVKGDLMNHFYTFDIGRGETPGVFAKAVGVNGRRGAIIDEEKTFPDDWCCDQHPVVKSPADLVVYELHHRDFSIARRDAKYPGKFLALTEPWAIDHLKQLGVTAVHILPSYDYGSVDETRLSEPQYNWGYDPVNYNVPEGSYATDPYDPVCRIREFKQMVQALHQAGIAVILDVVYNHTYDIDHSNFQLTYPDYYYRTTTSPSKEGKGPDYSNGSGCGNETASDKPMMRRFMIESVKHWYNEYRVDGFRFDLMGCHDIETMNLIRQELTRLDPSIFIYGEGWSAGQCALPTEQLGMKANISRMPGIAAFSDEIRDALRGPFSDDTKPGWLGGAPDCEESLKFGIVGAISHPQVDMTKVNYSKEPWALEPTQMLSYVSCHDDMCLTDRLRASIPSCAQGTGAAASNDELIRLDLLAQTAVFTSQGVPFMLAGEELLRTKQGVHNSFESPDSINRIDWDNARKYPQVLKYYRDLIALRRHHPAFRLGDAHLVRKHLEFLDAPKGVVAFRLKDYAGRDDWRNIIVILNANRAEATVAIPKGMYTVVCKDGEIDEQSTSRIFGRRTTVGPQSALILHD